MTETAKTATTLPFWMFNTLTAAHANMCARMRDIDGGVKWPVDAPVYALYCNGCIRQYSITDVRGLLLRDEVAFAKGGRELEAPVLSHQDAALPMLPRQLPGAGVSLVFVPLDVAVAAREQLSLLARPSASVQESHDMFVDRAKAHFDGLLSRWHHLRQRELQVRLLLQQQQEQWERKGREERERTGGGNVEDKENAPPAETEAGVREGGPEEEVGEIEYVAGPYTTPLKRRATSEAPGGPVKKKARRQGPTLRSMQAMRRLTSMAHYLINNTAVAENGEGAEHGDDLTNVFRPRLRAELTAATATESVAV